MTDHNPLIKLLGDRTLDDISNSRLFSLRDHTLMTSGSRGGGGGGGSEIFRFFWMLYAGARVGGRYKFRRPSPYFNFFIINAETLDLESEVGRSPFPSRYMYSKCMNQYDDMPRSRNLFCKIMQASAKPCRIFSCFSPLFFPVFFLFFVFTPTEFTGHRVM